MKFKYKINVKINYWHSIMKEFLKIINKIFKNSNSYNFMNIMTSKTYLNTVLYKHFTSFPFSTQDTQKGIIPGGCWDVDVKYFYNLSWTFEFAISFLWLMFCVPINFPRRASMNSSPVVVTFVRSFNIYCASEMQDLLNVD